MHTVYKVHTVSCSSKDCKKEATASGEDDAVREEFYNRGWRLHEIILGRESLDLCPDCAKEVAQFLFGEDS